MVGGLVLLLIALALFAAVDVPLQLRLHASRLKMSHQELKQEHKELEGNAEIKGKVRARMREMTKRRMMAAVPKADLVVMNPTHYAVALKYDDKTMNAPRVVAKGADLIALHIRDLAKSSQVPVLEAPVLARALYAHAELDREIPAPPVRRRGAGAGLRLPAAGGAGRQGADARRVAHARRASRARPSRGLMPWTPSDERPHATAAGAPGRQRQGDSRRSWRRSSS